MSPIIKKIVNTDVDAVRLQDFNKGLTSGYSVYGTEEVLLPSDYEEICEKIINFEVRDDDIFVVSFPKTGTTWCQEMVWLIANDLDYEGAKVFIGARFPFIEVQGLYAKTEATEWMGPRFKMSIETATNASSPRFIKSHLPWQLLPEDIQSRKKSAKIIYICRNPKDCVVSYYHHVKIFDGYSGSFDDFFRLFINGKVNYAPFWDHILSFWKRRNDSNTLFLRYEDLKSNLPTVIKEVSNFLDKKYSDDDINTLTQHLSFDSMKNNRAVNVEVLIEAGQDAGIITRDAKFMRSGKVGDFKVHMTPEQIAEMNAWTESHIKGTDFVPFHV